jgi:peroxiredoxin
MRPTALLAACLAVGLVASLAWAATTYKVGDDVADHTLAMSDGKDAKLSSHEGKVVLLLFYGTWARHADDDAARVDAIRKARAKQKLVVIGVARDAKPADAKKFGEDKKLGFPQAADAKSELYAKFASKGLPYVVVLDGKRKLKMSAAGVDEEAVEALLADLLGAKDPPPEKKKDEAAPAGGEKK